MTAPEQDSLSSMGGAPTATVELDSGEVAQVEHGGAPPSGAPVGLPERYTVHDRIGEGGSCEVFVAEDRELDRVVAIKVLRVGRQGQAEAVRQRFLAEAQVTARLPHPGVIPVYGRGALPDGRPWFAMKFVRGPTFGDVIRELHTLSTPTEWAPTPAGWTFWRLVDALARCCDTIAYAHSVSVVHRDLKPSNVMLGQFGEALVMDWGLAKLVGVDASAGGPATRGGETQDLLLAPAPAPLVLPTRNTLPRGTESRRTHFGAVVGTPQYMAPEVACGQLAGASPAVDIWGLGTLLYELLTGHAPYPTDGVSAVAQLRQGQMPAPVRALLLSHPRLPEALVEVCERAMRRDPSARYADAAEVGAAIRAWLDGSVRLRQALAMIDEARSHGDRAAAVARRAEGLRQASRRMLEGVRDYDPVERKVEAWAAEDEAAGLELQAAELRAAMLERARSALSLVPELREAHELLAAHHAEQLLAAEAQGDGAAAVLHEQALRQHDRGPYARLLGGEAELTLRTDPPGAQVEAARLVRSLRRIVEEPVGPIGRADDGPLLLHRGTFLLSVRAPGCAPVQLHVRLQRSERWALRPPGAAADQVLRLPRAEELGPDDVWIPPGWFEAGGDPQAVDSLPAARVWVDGFVIERDAVTNARWLAYVNALVDEGAVEQARAAVPRRPTGEGGGPAWPQGPDGHYSLPDSSAGADIEWRLQAPVVRISFWAAQAWCRWTSTREGLPWRLPHELEWEKAARGVDGRTFPWGDHVDGTYACTSASHEGTPSIAEVGSYPVDRSPWGLRDMGGNAQCWCDTPWSFEGHGVAPDGRLRLGLAPGVDCDPRRIIRGGAWSQVAQISRCATRFVSAPEQWWSAVGVRRVRSL
ncbi:MAG: SUMF1/EgtB/PvdO family nonheme iron enzyme [Deltaproteobacteria bacterium]|nr:SUMF1/EgtB/PvdO family nonheme iron enzyme [Deltaproteobacteria bacterium]